jgi:protoporphyrinogen oxidase
MNTHYDTVIIGAGLTGLTTGYWLLKAGLNDFIILEKEQRPGGLCRTEQKGRFLFDYCGHLLHFDSKEMNQLVGELLKDNLDVHTRNSKIFSHNVLTQYPFQCHLHGLPQEIIIECIESFVYARYQNKSDINNSSFGLWVESTFGKGIAQNFMLPYNEKLWVYDPYKLTTEWMKGFVPATDLHQILTGAFSSSPDTAGYNGHFSYPVKGGIEELVRALTVFVTSALSVENEVIQVDPVTKTIISTHGTRISYGRLVSTMPLNRLIQKIHGVPHEILAKNELLQCSSVVNINLAIKGIKCEGISWIYFPENMYVFYRIGFYSSFAPQNCQPGTTSLYIEISYRNTMPDKQSLYNQTITQLQQLGIISTTDDILECCILDVPCAYVTYDDNWEHSRNGIHDWLHKNDIFSIGRYGSWEYSDMEASMQQAQQTVRGILH